MKFGKRRQDADAPDAQEAPVSATNSAPPPAPDSWTIPAGEQSAPTAEAEAPDAAEEPFFHEPPVPSDEPVYHQGLVVEGEAVELPSDEPTAPVFEPPADTPVFEPPVPLTVQQPQPEPVAYPQAEQPVRVVTPGPGPDPVTTLGDSGEAFASGHAAAPGPSWQEPVAVLANERPEFVVAAAFAGGVLAAMILRRLGS
jgi:hypothetical protein